MLRYINQSTVMIVIHVKYMPIDRDDKCKSNSAQSVINRFVIFDSVPQSSNQQYISTTG